MLIHGLTIPRQKLVLLAKFRSSLSPLKLLARTGLISPNCFVHERHITVVYINVIILFVAVFQKPHFLV